MKVIFDFSAAIQFKGVETEAASLRDAYDQLYMTLADLLPAGSTDNLELSNIDGQIVRRDLRVKAYNIQYEDEDFVSGDTESPRTTNLPTEWVGDVNVSVEVDAVKDGKFMSADAVNGACDFDIREEIRYEIEGDLDLGIKVVSFDYIIVDEFEW